MRRKAPVIKEEFPKGWLYKLLYWHEIYGPIKNENPYVRMRKKYFWYVRMGKGKGRKRQ